jgi:O-antigen ligase
VITAIVFLIVTVLFWVFSFTKGPFWALMAYVNIYFNSPLPHINWWATYLPNLRWSFIAFIVLAISMMIHRKELASFEMPTIKWIYVFLLLTFVVTFTNAVNFTIAKWHTYMLFTFCLTVFVLIKTVSTLGRLRYLLLFILILTMNLSFKAITEGKRVHARLENIGTVDTFGSNEFGLLLVGILPFVLPFIFKGERYERIICILCVPLLLNAVILTNSRSALVALVCAFFYGFLFTANSKIRKYIIVALVCVLPAFLYLADDYFIDRMSTLLISDATSTSELNRVSSGRWAVWKHGIEMVKDYPFGAAPGGFRALAHFYMPEEELIFKPGMPYGVKAAHNSYLLVLVEQGFFGAFVFIYLCLSTVYYLGKCIKLLKKIDLMDSFMGYLVVAFNISFMSILVGGMFNSRIYYEFFWWQVALSLICYALVKNKYDDTCTV